MKEAVRNMMKRKRIDQTEIEKPKVADGESEGG